MISGASKITRGRGLPNVRPQRPARLEGVRELYGVVYFDLAMAEQYWNGELSDDLACSRERCQFIICPEYVYDCHEHIAI